MGCILNSDDVICWCNWDGKKKRECIFDELSVCRLVMAEYFRAGAYIIGV